MKFKEWLKWKFNDYVLLTGFEITFELISLTGRILNRFDKSYMYETINIKKRKEMGLEVFDFINYIEREFKLELQQKSVEYLKKDSSKIIVKSKCDSNGAYVTGDHIVECRWYVSDISTRKITKDEFLNNVGVD